MRIQTDEFDNCNEIKHFFILKVQNNLFSNYLISDNFYIEQIDQINKSNKK